MTDTLSPLTSRKERKGIETIIAALRKDGK
jgi:hypothetical protein